MPLDTIYTEFPLFYDFFNFIFVLSYSTLFLGLVGHVIKRITNRRIAVILAYIFFILGFIYLMRAYPNRSTLILVFIGLLVVYL